MLLNRTQDHSPHLHSCLPSNIHRPVLRTWVSLMFRILRLLVGGKLLFGLAQSSTTGNDTAAPQTGTEVMRAHPSTNNMTSSPVSLHTTLFSKCSSTLGWAPQHPTEAWQAPQAATWVEAAILPVIIIIIKLHPSGPWQQTNRLACLGHILYPWAVGSVHPPPPGNPKSGRLLHPCSTCFIKASFCGRELDVLVQNSKDSPLISLCSVPKQSFVYHTRDNTEVRSGEIVTL